MSDSPTTAGDMPEDGAAASRYPAASMTLTPGATLAAARQAQGLTIEQIASQLNLAPRQVVALETDDYAALPGMVIARGFLRAYAKLLRIDSVPLLAGLGDPTASSHAAPMRHALSASFSESRLPSHTAPGTRSKALPVLAGLLVLVVAGAGSYAMGWWPEALTRKMGLMKLGSLTRPPAADAGSVAYAIQPAPGAEGAAAPAARDSLLTGSTLLSVPAADTAADAAGKAPAAPAVVPAASSSGTAANSLVLNFQKDSWVEIKRADNTLVVAKVMKAGSVETFDISGPVTLTIGNIAGVEASLRGTPLKLANAATGNVARLHLK